MSGEFRFQKLIQAIFSWKFLKRLSIQSLIFLLLLELGLALLTRIGWSDSFIPSYSMRSNKEFVGHFDPDVGYLHAPGGHSHFCQSCYDCSLDYNREGFRDEQHKLHAIHPRWVFLGDSFTEGFGVNEPNRFTQLIETKMHVECLNFGISGTGPVQYQEIYRKFARKYDHDAVIVGLYPTNDFADDTPIQGSTRPYWLQTEDEWNLVKPTEKSHGTNGRTGLKLWLYSYSYTYNFWQYLKKVLSSKQEQTRYGHWKYTDAQWSRLQRALEEIKHLSQDRRMIVYTIPGLEEIARSKEGEVAPLSLQLERFCVQNDIVFADLNSAIFSFPLERRSSLYLQCDGHLSIEGNKYVARFLSHYLNP